MIMQRPQHKGYVYKRLSVCKQTTVNDTADTVWRRKAYQSDVVAKVALLVC